MLSAKWEPFCLSLNVLLFSNCFFPDSPVPNNRQNVLFLMADDMRPDLSCYYQGEDQPTPTHPPMHTPNLDALASRSLLFKRAYVQYALCAPSRQSLLTSRRPDTTRVYGFNTRWRTRAGNFTSLPQYFKEHGFNTIGMGKIFHEKTLGSDHISWTEPFFIAPTDLFYNRRRTNVWEEIPRTLLQERPLPDSVIATRAIDTLQRLAPAALSGERPFFLAVGFIKPHLPFQYPEAFTHYYEAPNMPMPIPAHASDGMPTKAWTTTHLGSYRNSSYNRLKNHFNQSFPAGLVRELRAGYYRSLSFSDSQIGLVLQELYRLGLGNSTIVSFMGDHGWHLGEQGMWRKGSNFEVAVRIPLMISAPGLTDGGRETRALVEAVDVFPTLVDLAGLPHVNSCQSQQQEEACTEGRSMLPLFHDQDAPFKEYAFSQVKHKKDMGYTVRNNRYRYTCWVKVKNGKPCWIKNSGEELYDYKKDKHETRNLVSRHKYRRVVRRLKAVLRNAVERRNDDGIASEEHVDKIQECWWRRHF